MLTKYFMINVLPIYMKIFKSYPLFIAIIQGIVPVISMFIKFIIKWMLVLFTITVQTLQSLRIPYQVQLRRPKAMYLLRRK